MPRSGPLGAVALLATLALRPHAVPPAPAPLRLSRLVSTGMVMQRGIPVPVWGWAEPGRRVTVVFDGHSYGATTNARGEWRVALPAMTAGGPHAMTVVAGAARVAVRDILVGDVWICSGQSNMEFAVANARDGAREVAAAHDPRVRQFKVPTSWAAAPERDVAGGEWQPADPAHVGRFTAVGWFFARDLRAALRQSGTSGDVPIGLINTSWGGSRIEPWMSRDAVKLDSTGLDRLLADERAAEQRVRDGLLARLGRTPPTIDSGLVAGRALWADPALDDASWRTIPVPGLWETAGYESMDGVAWYRTTLDLTADEARAGVTLGLGMIDDSDVSWVNGVEVGRMTNAYDTARRYAVPPSALHAGRNVIAVRVDDTGGGGGIAGDTSTVYVETNGVRRPLGGAWRFRVGAVSFKPDGQRINKVPTLLYNAMIAPLAPYPVAGALWYQGESNADHLSDAVAYHDLLPGLIADWRRAWGRADLPFVVVQLPNYMAADSVPPATSAWATLREAQQDAARLPNVAVVTTIDLGDAGNIHPTNKQDVGARVALAVRRLAYHQAVVATGPTYHAHHVETGRVAVQFDAAGHQLATRGNAKDVAGFAIAGEDHRFVWANARIEGERVVVWSDAVPNPVAVRYAWADNPDRANLTDAAGLPAPPFRTDRW